MLLKPQERIVGNLVSLHDDTVNRHFIKFVSRSGVDSENTATEYKRDIERFFKEMLDKEVKHLKIKDLDIKRSDVEMYQTFLVKKGYKSATINRMLASVKSFYNSIEADQFKYQDKTGEIIYIKSAPFMVDKITKDDSDGYGILSHDEITQMMELAKATPNGVEKSLLIELASVTSMRLEALLSLSWSDFRVENDVWVVKTVDKGKSHTKAVRSDIYEKLVETKKDEKVFHLTARTVQRTIQTLVEEMKLDTERNLAFHSIKKYGIYEVYLATGGDIMKTAEQGNHSSFETTKKYYLQFDTDYSTAPSLYIGKTLDMTPLEELTKEQLMELITSSDRGLQYQLLNNLNKLKNRTNN